MATAGRDNDDMQHRRQNNLRDVAVDLWLYGVQQPVRLRSAGTSGSSSPSSQSSIGSAPLLTRPEMIQEQRCSRKLGLTSLVDRVRNSRDVQPLLKQMSFCARLGVDSLSLELCHELGNSTVVELSLLASSIMWAPVASVFDDVEDCKLPSYILAIAPETPSCNQQDRLGKAWIFCANCSLGALHNLLFDLGRAGALRWDFDENYRLDKSVDLGLQVSSTPRWIGKACTSFVFPGKPEVAAVEFTEESANLRDQLGILACSQSHPNIIKFYGAFYHPDGDNLMLAFQNEPRDLATRIQLFGTLDQHMCLEITFSVLTALAYLHFHHVVHRNVNPHSIRLGRQQEVILAGLSAAVNIDSHAALKTVPRTSGFVAPELIAQGAYGVKVDVFSVGATYFTALTGHEPFRNVSDGDNQAAQLQRILEFDEDFEVPKFKAIPVRLQFLAKAMLRHNPRARPSAADAANSYCELMPSLQLQKVQAANDLHKELQGILEAQASDEEREDTHEHPANLNDDNISCSSKSSVLDAVFTPESALERQERQPNLPMLEEMPSPLERSSVSSLSYKSLSTPSERSTPMERSSPLESSRLVPIGENEAHGSDGHDPRASQAEVPESSSREENPDASRDLEAPAVPGPSGREQIVPVAPAHGRQTSAASQASSTPSGLRGGEQTVPVAPAHDRQPSAAPQASSTPSGFTQSRPYPATGWAAGTAQAQASRGLPSQGQAPSTTTHAASSSSSSSSSPWPVRAVLGAARNARDARDSMWQFVRGRNRTRTPQALNAESLLPLVPDAAGPPEEPRPHRRWRRARIQPDNDSA